MAKVFLRKSGQEQEDGWDSLYVFGICKAWKVLPEIGCIQTGCLEIVSDKRNSIFYQPEFEEDLLSCAWKTWTIGAPLQFLDPSLRGYPRNEIIRYPLNYFRSAPEPHRAEAWKPRKLKKERNFELSKYERAKQKKPPANTRRLELPFRLLHAHLLRRPQKAYAMGLVSLGLVCFSCLLVILNAQPDFRYSYCLSDNYTTNSMYETNLNTLLSNLTSNTEIDYGFYNLSYGPNSDRVNAFGLCRGDVKPSNCRSCLENSRVLLPQKCPVQKAAIGGYDECMLYYSNRSISGLVEPFTIYMWSVGNASEWNQYNQVVRDLLDKITSAAASGDSHLKFAAANATGPRSQDIYGSVQCKPDLSEQECSSCLTGAISEISECCNGKLGGRVIKPNCNFRFENYLFYEFSTDAPTPASSPQNSAPPSPPFVPTNTTSSQGKNKRLRIIIAIVVPIVAIVVLLIFLCISRARKPRKDSEGEAETENDIKPTDSIQFEFRTIQVATNNFSNANKLGQGGFGPVYKGKLSNGQEVAIKRKNSGSRNENVEHLPSIAWKNWRRGTTSKIVDPTLDEGSMNEIMRCIQIGLLCVQEKAVDRPTLASVLLMLEGHSVSLPVPSRPAFFMKNATLSETNIYSGASSTLPTDLIDASRNDVSITELYPR
ncbi:hypothetical protein L6164_032157 [Bauhinia variegata]|uniref:Uncharacterized protein n=1 Tax=Bauhinia variegata TaxID=167791 RepID=A0ACB9KMX2_BAUVA|nr:hypothetical protein L6164_032157 [Bauhinia variegata]